MLSKGLWHNQNSTTIAMPVCAAQARTFTKQDNTSFYCTANHASKHVLHSMAWRAR